MPPEARRESRGPEEWLSRRGTWGRALLIAALVGAIFGVKGLFGDPRIGIAFLYLLPILLAAGWFGRMGGLIVAVFCSALFIVGSELFFPEGTSWSAVLLRLAIFTSMGFLFAHLLQRQIELRTEIAEGERRLEELHAIRDALIPPDVPPRPSLDLASSYVPAEQGVAGDFFVVAPAPGDATVVVIGDVVGHGLEAARRASFVRTAFATFAPFTDDPCRLLELANQSLIEKAGTSEAFVTAACLAFRPDQRAVSWSLAGHPPPLRLSDGSPLTGAPPGLPLGIEFQLGCGRMELPVTDGEGFLLYTDGLTEARRHDPDRTAEGTLLGSERVGRVLAELPEKAPDQAVRALRELAESFAGGRLTDDLCMVALRARAG